MGPMSPICSILIACAMVVASAVGQAQVPGVPAPGSSQVTTTGTPVPLLSLDAIHFLEGTWTAFSRDGQTVFGSYSFVRELNGHILARHSAVDPSCTAAEEAACARKDLFYVYQESPGAPLQAISFDNEGHVIHFFIDLTVQGSTSTLGRRDFVIFTSDPTQLGPRVRLRYVHNVDTATGKEVLEGAFEMLQPDGQWRPLQQWYGTRQ